MDFPKVKNNPEWKLTKTGNYSIILKDRTERIVAIKTSYEKCGELGEKIMEWNIFGNGVATRMWIIKKDLTQIAYSQIKCRGNWITGLKNELATIRSLSIENKFAGVELKLKITPNKTEKIEILNVAFGLKI